jgi:hypothetical protein
MLAILENNVQTTEEQEEQAQLRRLLQRLDGAGARKLTEAAA